jgi:hypothetical protein
MEHGFRHELKYIIDTCDLSRLRPLLAAVMRKDPFADAEGRYHVRSLYFDDTDDSCFFDKLDGLEDREKYRIRIYNKSDRTVKFEKKTKVDDFVRKESALITCRDCLEILHDDPDCLFAAGGEVPRGLYLAFRTRLLRPVVVVDYIREAYVYAPGNVRVTFDMDLAYRSGSTDIFNPRLSTIAVLSRPELIMEVKYDAFLPDVVAGLLRGVQKTRQAVSKYLLCREAA